MKHLGEMELMELCGGHLPGARQAAAEEHLAVCAECAARRRELAGLWDLLGEWQVRAGAPDLSEAVAARVRTGAQGPLGEPHRYSIGQ